MAEDTENTEGTEALGGMDFNVEDEYKPDPLIPAGTYHGAVTNVSFNAAAFNIAWDICLHDNGGEMNDGETPIDGAHVRSVNWLPKPGDDSELTPSGSMTKRQWKINALADQLKALDLTAVTAAEIAEAIESAEWIGLEVDVTVAIEEYNGKFSSKVKLGGLKSSTL